MVSKYVDEQLKEKPQVKKVDEKFDTITKLEKS
jgi:hypothetical protein